MIIRNYSGEMANLMESYYLCVGCSLTFSVNAGSKMMQNVRCTYLLCCKEQLLLHAKQMVVIKQKYFGTSSAWNNRGISSQFEKKVLKTPQLT